MSERSKNGKKLLITGFEPFGKESINPAWEAVARLPEQIGAYDLRKLRIPTVFGMAAETVLEEAKKQRPDAILCIGLAGGRKEVTPEMVAINLRHAEIPDNRGAKPQDEPIEPQGPAAYFATAPVRKMAQAMEKEGVLAKVSYSAGTFVCNELYYKLLHYFSGSETKVGFLHVPYLLEQARDGAPAMSLEMMGTALAAAVLAL